MICASCLSKEAIVAKAEKAKKHFPFWAVLQLVAALVLCWLAFYYASGFLSDLPDEFHDGTVWE